MAARIDDGNPEASAAERQPTISRRDLLKSGLHGGYALAGLGSLIGNSGCSGRGGGSAAERSDVPTVVLITLDTTRADHLGCYGYHRPTSRHLDAFANACRVYERAISPGTWTLPTHASLFTGRFTASHGARYDPDGPIIMVSAMLEAGEDSTQPDAQKKYRVRPMAPAEQTMASLLKQAGYMTGAVVAGPWMKKLFGLNSGFDFYDDSGMENLNGRIAQDVTRSALEWLKTTADHPRFLFLNYFDAHAPLAPPPGFEQLFLSAPLPPPNKRSGLTREQSLGLYDAEIFYMDVYLGRLFDGLKKLGLYENAMIIVTADHGHLYGEHDQFNHGGVPYQEVVSIPLIIKEPGGAQAGDRLDDWVQLTDLLPMILTRLGLAVPDSVQGAPPTDKRHPVVIESRTLPNLDESIAGDWLSIIDDGMKYIRGSQGTRMLFDINQDPGEQKDLFMTDPDRARALDDALYAYLSGLPEPSAVAPSQQVDPETLKALKSVGYVD